MNGLYRAYSVINARYIEFYELSAVQQEKVGIVVKMLLSQNNSSSDFEERILHDMLGLVSSMKNTNVWASDLILTVLEYNYTAYISRIYGPVISIPARLKEYCDVYYYYWLNSARSQMTTYIAISILCKLARDHNTASVEDEPYISEAFAKILQINPEYADAERCYTHMRLTGEYFHVEQIQIEIGNCYYPSLRRSLTYHLIMNDRMFAYLLDYGNPREILKPVYNTLVAMRKGEELPFTLDYYRKLRDDRHLSLKAYYSIYKHIVPIEDLQEVQGEEGIADCSICYKYSQYYRYPKCNHQLCMECIKKWNRSQYTCPMCRSKVK